MNASPKATPEDTRYRAPALDKGLDILELLAGHLQGMTRAEIIKALNRSPSEIYRMLERLVARRYVIRSTEGDRYSLSLKLLALGLCHPPIGRMVALAQPLMNQFSAQAEQSCHLGVYDQGNVLVIAQVPGPGVWGMAVRIGAHVGLVDTCSGQVLLAFQAPEQRARMLAEHRAVQGEIPFPQEKLEASCQRIAAQGHECRESLQSYGVTDISSPILGPDGHAIAVLTSPYIRRIDQHAGPSLETALTLLQEAAAALSPR